jgi:dTDP-4-dehydrorhamnose 3,5-epimerase
MGWTLHGCSARTEIPVTLRFTKTDVLGVLLVDTAPHEDERGLFARLYCPDAFAEAGLGQFAPVQINLSTNRLAGTLRGMHYQPRPHAEDKLVHVVRGRVFDVAVDLRPESPTYRKWTGVELRASEPRGLFIPEGCAHGFLTLEDHSDIHYQMGRMFEPGHAARVRWNDPAFGIAWPAEPAVMADADRDCPDYEGQAG